MKNKKVLRRIFTSSGYYIWVIFVIGIAMSVFDLRLALIMTLFSAICMTANIIYTKGNKKNIKSFLKNITEEMYVKTPDIFGGKLIPFVIIRHDGMIIWSNEGFNKICGTSIVKKIHLNEIIPDFELCKCLNSGQDGFYKVLHNGKTYHAEITSTQIDNENFYAICFNDCTDYELLKKKYQSEKFVCGIIVVDNYDDVMIDVLNSDKPKISAAIEETLNIWAQSVNGIIKKHEKDRFMFYFSNQGLEKMIENRFDILESIRSIAVGNKLSPTLSIGIGCGGENMLQNETFAYNSLDMALGRGGDQAVIKQGDKNTYIGGKSQETEKRTKVKARVVAEALKQLIYDNDEILIMGHKNADNDSFGAAVGLYAAIKTLGKSCKIVMESYNQTVAKTLDTLPEQEYADLVINKAYANEIISRRTLLFVVDTHAKSMVEEPSLLDVTKNIIIIDHHRRSSDFIANPLISYHEPYASSASELVTEIIQYIGDKVKLSKKEAEAIYSGIYMDTKNFTFKTGSRTFEAASYLKKSGVDTIAVKKLFQIDVNTFMKKWQILEAAETYKHSISIAKCEKTDVNMSIIVAQAADELLNITDITCAFVLCDMGGSVQISARSLGTYNIQIIMEKLGGGGHLTMAATQLSNVDINEAETMLKNAIDEYIKENNINDWSV